MRRPLSALASPKVHASVTARLRAAGCVFAEQEAELLIAEGRSPTELEAMVERRVAGERLEHILGWAEFCGQRIAVGLGVFVPRYRTEFLARQAVALARPGTVVVDMCCGSGALGAVLAARVGRIKLYAADIDPVAVDYARRNITTFGGKAYRGDLFGALPPALKGGVAIVVANVPYVPTGSIEFLSREARDHEPRVALDGGSDGLELLRRVAAEAPRWLAPGGHLLIEINEHQADQAIKAFTTYGLASTVATSGELNASVIIGIRSS